MVTVMRWYAQSEVDQEESEQNDDDGMKKEMIPMEQRLTSVLTFYKIHLTPVARNAMSPDSIAL